MSEQRVTAAEDVPYNREETTMPLQWQHEQVLECGKQNRLLHKFLSCPQ